MAELRASQRLAAIRKRDFTTRLRQRLRWAGRVARGKEEVVFGAAVVRFSVSHPVLPRGKKESFELHGGQTLPCCERGKG